MNATTVTTYRQEPVIARLRFLLDQTEATAAAVADNAIEDCSYLPTTVASDLLAQIRKIYGHIQSTNPEVI